jgi:hypothetical protein
MARNRPLQCPFCDNYLIAPVDITMKSLEISGGICRCGAVYAMDRSGHNLGEIFMDALTFACRGDIDRAMSLDPGDYESIEFDYNLQSNTIGGRGVIGKLSKIVFIKLHDDRK